MASSDALDAELARLSGSELVARLRTTCHIADYEAAARVLDARDARLATAEAALAQAKEGLDARVDRLAKVEAALVEAKEDLHARDASLAKVEAALAEAKADLKVRDRRLAKAEAELAEAKKGLVSRDGRLATAEAALAEAKEGQDARDARVDKAEAALAETKEGLSASDAKLAQMHETVTIALTELRTMRGKYDALEAAFRETMSEGARAQRRGQDAPPGAAIAAAAPAPRSEVAQEKGRVVIDLCSSDDEEGEGRRPGACGVSLKRKPAACSSDDEDDSLTLSQLMKKKRDGAQPGADGEPKNADSSRPLVDYVPQASLVIKQETMEATVGGFDEPNVTNFVQGRGNVKSRDDGGMSRAMPSHQPVDSAVTRANSAESLGIDQPGMSLVFKEEAIEATFGAFDNPKVAKFVKERGNVKSADNSGMSRGMLSTPPPGFAARTMEVSRAPPPGFPVRTGSPPPGFAERTGSQKNLSKADHGGPRIAGKYDSFARQEEDTLAQVKNPYLSARKIVESARAGSVSPKGRTGSAPGDNMVLGLEAIREQEMTNGEGHNAKVLPGTNAIEEQIQGGMVARAIVEQDETKGLLLKRNVRQATNGIGKQRGKISPRQRREISDGGQLRTSDKQLRSTTLLTKNELHSQQTSVEDSLPLAITRNWKYETDMFTSCLENKEICMQGVCALYRQKKLFFKPTEGGRSGSNGLCKSDIHRVTKLVDFLLDGNGQGPLKRTVEELMKRDSTGPILLEKVVCQLRGQLFCIYKNKEDPYFR